MIDKVLEERGNRYGTFADHAVIAQSLIEVIRRQPNWANLKPDARQALTVICDKMARMLNGDPEYDDNWVDIIGYATLVLNRMKADQRQAQEAEDLEDEKRASAEGMYHGKADLWGEENEENIPSVADMIEEIKNFGKEIGINLMVKKDPK